MDDKEITFLLPIYYNHEAAMECINSIRLHYPLSPIVLLPDGDPYIKEDKHGIIMTLADRPFKDSFVCMDENVILRATKERLKLAKHGGLWWINMLKQVKTKYAVKLDPDTEIHRKLTRLSDCDLFGTFVSVPGVNYSYLRGGFIGFKSTAIKTILDSKLLCDKKYTTARYGFLPIAPSWKTFKEEDLLLISDHVLGDVADRLLLTIENHPEIKCNWNQPVINNNLEYAVTHPRANKQ